MFCKNCGRVVTDNVPVCPVCGCEIDCETDIKVQANELIKKSEDFYSHKLLLSTLISILSLFAPVVLGFIPAIISISITKELPKDYCPLDRERAINIAVISLVLNVICSLIVILVFLGSFSMYR